MDNSKSNNKEEFSKIKFIRDDTAKERERIFGQIIAEVKKDIETEKRIIVGRRFIKALFKSAFELKNKKISEETIKKEPRKKTITEKKAIIENVPTPPLEDSAITDKIEYPILATKDNKNLVYVSIEYTPSGGRYSVIEPLIDQKLIDNIKELAKNGIEKDRNKLSDDKFIIDITKSACKKTGLEFKEEIIDRVKYYLYRDFVFFSTIDPLLHDRNVKEIICEGVDKPVKVIDYSLQKLNTNIILIKNEDINDIINRFAKKSNVTLSDKNPTLETVYKNLKISATLGFGGVSSRFTIKNTIP